jgi:hypothetical protein
MAVIHKTTMNPSKVELLAAWLPRQPWYLGAGCPPRLARAGGFRLDDPAGEVGIEFAVGTDHSTDRAVTYLMPMTYRGQVLPDGEAALIGTSQHGVLGKRWIYDGTRDLVMITQLVALIQGQAIPQAQSVSNTTDPTVTSHPAARSPLTVTGSTVEANGPSGTDLRIQTAITDGKPGGQLLLRIVRILEPDPTPGGDLAEPGVSATWRHPDGTIVRGTFATASLAGQPV